ncbi:Tyrosine-protein kinase CSK [Holothuria leucospilota]|uniref:Tyrosine-protein kinase CSK n=1 Tax=Holothuria leucospilota TaxID=206669 RepID=A0A9Q1HE29_HOLLE|nr:Tyrosine-protein kinase CSK [Holothuria leucospilota]
MFVTAIPIFLFAVGRVMNVNGDTPNNYQANNRTFNVFYTAGHEVRLHCNISQDSTNQAIWKRKTSYGDDLLFVGLVAIRNMDLTNIKVSSANYSLIFHSVTPEDEGLYICKQFAQTLASYYLNIIDISDLQIQYRGKNATQALFVDTGDILQLDCIFFGTKKKPDLEWQVRDKALAEHSTGEVVRIANKYVEGTFDFRKRLTYLYQEDTLLICSSFDDYNSRISVTIHLKTEHKEGNINSRRILPDVPIEKHSYSRKINEEDIYSAVSYNLPSSKVFIRKRISLITKLSVGVICERWIGKVTTADGEKKPTLITHLKGVICFDHFSWDGLVKRFLELPENAHVFSVQGMCFDEREYQRRELLIALSHPGLSMKKILINEDNVCKLYDFCLAEDASKFVERLKSEADFTPSSHPQECVTRNKYTCASDVWYTAFTVREIYSYGSRQYPCVIGIKREESVMYSLQPELCSTIVYDRVTACMTSNENERPKDLKGLLMDLNAEINSESTEDTSVQIEEENTRKYSSYLPVVGVMDRELYSTPVKLEN